MDDKYHFQISSILWPGGGGSVFDFTSLLMDLSTVSIKHTEIEQKIKHTETEQKI